MICSRCKQNKDTSEFYSKGKRLNSFCKPCFNAYCVERWVRRKKEAIEYKGGKCIKCGYNKYYGALHFHHRVPSEKDFDWIKLRLTSWERISKELDKCDLLCSNCHAEAHGGLS